MVLYYLLVLGRSYYTKGGVKMNPRDFLNAVEANYWNASIADGTVEGECAMQYEEVLRSFLTETICLGGMGFYRKDEAKDKLWFIFWSPIR